MERLLVFIFAVALSANAVDHSLPCTAPCFYGPQAVLHKGVLRYYAAYFPAGIVPSQHYPLLVVLNSASSSGYHTPQIDAQSLFQSFADANNVAVLWLLSSDYDTGTVRGSASQPYQNCSSTTDACQWVWRLPSYFTSYYADNDDFGYITDRISNAVNAWSADASRILLVGGSTGGLEAHAYAQANPSSVLAIGTFAGPLWAQSGNSTPFPPTGPVNAFMAHGDADSTLAYCGGPTNNPWYGLTGISTASADQTFEYWTGPSGMNCSTVIPGAELCPASGGIMQKVATGCAAGKRAMFRRVPNAGHLAVGNYSYDSLTQFWTFVFPPTGDPTSTVLTSIANPVAVGQPVNLMATVSSMGGTPTGKVEFLKNGNPFGTALLINGQASVNLTFGAAGTKSFTAYYTGDATFAASNSLAFSEQVVPGSTVTTLVSSPNPSAPGQAVTFTATVISQSGGVPTGSVTFVRNGIGITTVPLVNGQAVFTQTLQGTGVKSITAMYSGDMNDLSSVSSVLAQTIQIAPTN